MNKKYIILAVTAFFMIITMLTFASCNFTRIKTPGTSQQSSDNKELVKNTEVVAVDSVPGNSEGEKTNDVEETSVIESAKAEINGDNYWEASDIMFYSTQSGFAFVYPQDSVTLSSNPYIRNDKPPFLLCVDISPEGEDALPMDYNFAYGPGVAGDFSVFVKYNENMNISAKK